MSFLRPCASHLAILALLLANGGCDQSGEGKPSDQNPPSSAEPKKAVAGDAAGKEAKEGSSTQSATPRQADSFGSLNMRLSTKGKNRLANDCFDVTVPDGFSFDLTLAKALLAEGGVPGAAFQHPDGAVFSVVCFGPSEESVSELHRRASEEQQKKKMVSVTYEEEGDDWFVITGTVLEGQGVIYTRGHKVGSAVIQTEVAWPMAADSSYRSRLDEISSSVTPSKKLLELKKSTP